MHLLVSGWFWDQLATGSGQYLHGLVAHLPEVAPQHTYTLLLPAVRCPPPDASGLGQPPPAGRASAVPAFWRVVWAATPFDRLSEDLAKLWFEQVAVPQAARRLAAGVVLTPYWGSPARRPCPTAVTVHDLIPLLLPAYRDGLLPRLYTRLVAWTARRAHLVLTDSEASRQDIVRHLGIPADRVRAVPLAVAERFRPVTEPAELARARARYDLPERFVLYLGGFDVRKNVARAMQAFALATARLPASAQDLCLVVAGRLPAADTPFTPDPRRLATEAGVADRVRFIGWVDEADKPALYTLAQAFLFPSLYEGFGLPAAEAAACGAAVVTSNRSSLPEAAPDAVLVDPEDVDSIAAGLVRALTRSRPTPMRPRTWREVAVETVRAVEAVIGER
ncbi:MAG: glycosyltransferase family 1 protein [Anaerolineae bacterium]|nr:glycosyltransferase family 1 protein [Anaerolineae bacterium]